MNGRLTYAEFEQQAVQFNNISTLLNDDWILQKVEGSCKDQEVLLKRKCFMHLAKPLEKCTDDTAEDQLSPEELTSDDISACHMPSYDCTEFCNVTYYILYNHSFSVPSIYFTATHLDGHILNTDELHMLFSPLHKSTMIMNIWSTVTQTEHPQIGPVCYMLHPCKTSDVMTQVTLDDKNRNCYLIQWLSSYGPAVRLEIPIDYFNLYLKTSSGVTIG